jgi:hypothetical protein
LSTTSENVLRFGIVFFSDRKDFGQLLLDLHVVGFSNSLNENEIEDDDSNIRILLNLLKTSRRSDNSNDPAIKIINIDNTLKDDDTFKKIQILLVNMIMKAASKDDQTSGNQIQRTMIPEIVRILIHQLLKIKAEISN